MTATKIRMMSGSENSMSLQEIDSIYVTGCDNPQFFKKAVIHDYLKEHPGSIVVNRYPYPELIPRISSNGEKYVQSTANEYFVDNLLSLPRE